MPVLAYESQQTNDKCRRTSSSRYARPQLSLTLYLNPFVKYFVELNCESLIEPCIDPACVVNDLCVGFDKYAPSKIAGEKRPRLRVLCSLGVPTVNGAMNGRDDGVGGQPTPATPFHPIFKTLRRRRKKGAGISEDRKELK